jgi:hypothetical protein
LDSISFISLSREYIDKLSSKKKAKILGFLPLNAHDLLNTLPYVKSFEVLSELGGLDLRVVK